MLLVGIIPGINNNQGMNELINHEKMDKKDKEVAVVVSTFIL